MQHYHYIFTGSGLSALMTVYELLLSGKFEDKSQDFGTEMSNGWWNMIKLADLDKDGDLDIIAGNLGSNSKFKASKEKPFKVYLKDFDENGTWDTYLGSYSSDGNIYPVRGRQCSSEQMPFIKDRFKSYNDFASKTIEEILDADWNQRSIINAKEITGLSSENARNLFRDVWLYSHGIATQIVSDDINLPHGEVVKLVENAFQRFSLVMEGKNE